MMQMERCENAAVTWRALKGVELGIKGKEKIGAGNVSSG